MLTGFTFSMAFCLRKLMMPSQKSRHNKHYYAAVQVADAKLHQQENGVTEMKCAVVHQKKPGNTALILVSSRFAIYLESTGIKFFRVSRSRKLNSPIIML